MEPYRRNWAHLVLAVIRILHAVVAGVLLVSYVEHGVPEVIRNQTCCRVNNINLTECIDGGRDFNPAFPIEQFMQVFIVVFAFLAVLPTNVFYRRGVVFLCPGDGNCADDRPMHERNCVEDGSCDECGVIELPTHLNLACYPYALVPLIWFCTGLASIAHLGTMSRAKCWNPDRPTVDLVELHMPLLFSTFIGTSVVFLAVPVAIVLAVVYACFNIVVWPLCWDPSKSKASVEVMRCADAISQQTEDRPRQAEIDSAQETLRGIDMEERTHAMRLKLAEDLVNNYSAQEVERILVTRVTYTDDEKMMGHNYRWMESHQHIPWVNYMRFKIHNVLILAEALGRADSMRAAIFRPASGDSHGETLITDAEPEPTEVPPRWSPPPPSYAAAAGDGEKTSDV